MDRKELIYKFSEETGEKVHAQLPDMGSYNDKYVYWLEQQVKNCSMPVVSEIRGKEERVKSLTGDCKCVKKCNGFSNVESMLFDFWSTLKNDVDCVNSENIISKIDSYVKNI